MRALNYLILAVLLAVPCASFADDLGLIRLNLIEGDVQMLIKDTTDWTDATINVPLNEGDRLWVPDSAKVELQVRGAVYVRADGNTALDVLTVNQDAAQFYIDSGHISINNLQGGIKTVQIDTPNTSFRSYDNSIMMIDITDENVAEVSVLKGEVYAENIAGVTRVSAGNTLTIRGDSSAELAPISAPDAWEQWNTERDQHQSSWSESSRYLPDELREYSSDFDKNGKWDYASDYGYVWFPAVTSATWAPYTMGTWVWIRGAYVWIAYDPWGWAPYHYGRWVHMMPRGWCWVPPAAGSAYWGPGYVGWIVTPSYVAWVPLAPGEIYYGYGYYGPSSVNISAIHATNVIANRTYVNAKYRNAVVVANRETFGTGRRVPVQVRENPFLEKKNWSGTGIGIVPPREKPKRPVVFVPVEVRDRDKQQHREVERTGVPEPRHAAPSASPSVPPSPTIRTGRPAVAPPVVQPMVQQVRPPDRVRKTQPEAVKKERKLVIERDSSVFRPQPPANMPVTKMREPRVINRAPVQQQKKEPVERQERREGR
jgi:hypothetical protein